MTKIGKLTILLTVCLMPFHASASTESLCSSLFSSDRLNKEIRKFVSTPRNAFSALVHHEHYVSPDGRTVVFVYKEVKDVTSSGPRWYQVINTAPGREQIGNVLELMNEKKVLKDMKRVSEWSPSLDYSAAGLRVQDVQRVATAIEEQLYTSVPSHLPHLNVRPTYIGKTNIIFEGVATHLEKSMGEMHRDWELSGRAEDVSESKVMYTTLKISDIKKYLNMSPREQNSFVFENRTINYQRERVFNSVGYNDKLFTLMARADREIMTVDVVDRAGKVVASVDPQTLKLPPILAENIDGVSAHLSVSSSGTAVIVVRYPTSSIMDTGSTIPIPKYAVAIIPVELF